LAVFAKETVQLTYYLLSFR